MMLTVAERKTRETARLRNAASLAMHELAAYAASHGGCFAVFGSFARGDICHASDFDVMVDFPSSAERKALAGAESICRAFGLRPDVHLASESSDALKARVERDAIRLS